MKSLLVEDNPADARLILEMLKESPIGTFELHQVPRLDAALERLRREAFDVVLLDLGLPDAQGLQTLTRMQAASGSSPIVVLTGLNDERFALEAVRAGAQDYLVKGRFDPPLLVRTIRHAIERKRTEEEVRRLNAELERRVAERTTQLLAANNELLKEISEHKRTEAALRESEQRYHVLSQATIEGIAITEGDRFLDVNEQFADMFAYTREELIGAEVVSLLPPEERERVMGNVRRGVESVIEHRALRKDGQVLAVEAHAKKMIYQGRPVRMTTIHDITARKHAEAALIRSEKLASVGRMAATIAHEINNPLAAVMNALYLARTDPTTCPSVRRYLDMADGELRRVASLTRQALGFYRERATPTTTSVPKILDSAVEVLKHKFGAKRVTLEKQYQTVPELMAVPGELRQVFTNVLTNSLDAVQERGIIKLRVSCAGSAANGDATLRVTVADNGVGIEKKNLPKMFEPFFTTKESIGTGLGLWISKQIVDNHGGSVRIRSTTRGSRRGTTVCVLIPAHASVRQDLKVKAAGE